MAIPTFDDAIVHAICKILGDAGNGLTHSEISAILQECGISDPQPSLSKANRLYEALSQRQQYDGCGNNVAAFVVAAMKPVRYLGNQQQFSSRQLELNKILSFAGLRLKDDGMLSSVTVATTIDQAEERAGRLRKLLEVRKVHADVLRFCRAELLQENYFHAVFEATKSIADKIRSMSGLTSDGSDLVDDAFGIGKKDYPVMAFNSLRTETEKSEHSGLMNLMKGLFSTFRNTTAHVPKIKWIIEEQDALDMLSLASLLHRRIDHAVLTQQGN